MVGGRQRQTHAQWWLKLEPMNGFWFDRTDTNSGSTQSEWHNRRNERAIDYVQLDSVPAQGRDSTTTEMRLRAIEWALDPVPRLPPIFQLVHAKSVLPSAFVLQALPATLFSTVLYIYIE